MARGSPRVDGLLTDGFRLVVNPVLPPEPLGEFLEQRREQEAAYLAQIEKLFPKLHRVFVPLLRRDVEDREPPHDRRLAPAGKEVATNAPPARSETALLIRAVPGEVQRGPVGETVLLDP